MPIFNRFPLRERIRIRKEATADVKAKLAAGKKPDQAIDEVEKEYSAKYGADVNWLSILETLFEVFQLIFAMFNDDNDGVEAPPEGMAAAAPQAPEPPKLGKK